MDEYNDAALDAMHDEFGLLGDEWVRVKASTIVTLIEMIRTERVQISSRRAYEVFIGSVAEE